MTSETIEKARAILAEIGNRVGDLEKQRQEASINADHDKIKEDFDQLAELSSQFYELIPHSQFAFDAVPPINDANELNKKVLIFII